MEIAKEKNTISSTLLQAKEMRHRNNMNSRIAFEHMDPDGNNLLDMSSVSPLEPSSQRPVASQGVDPGSFSYLPSIQGVYRGKLASGASADMGGVSGGYSGRRRAAGKNPLLMANQRRM